MKTLYIYILLLSSTIYGQDTDYWKRSWEKILIRDYYYTSHGNNSFFNDYQLTREKYELIHLRNKDSIVTKINPSLIDSLFIEINNQKKSKSNPLKMFNRNVNWVADNAEFLWDEYWKSFDEKKNKKIDSLAISILKDSIKTNKIVSSLQGERNNGHMPLVHVHIFTNNDSLKIVSNGGYPYMLPWYLKDKYIYNSNISTIISKILPDNLKVNEERLDGVEFNFTLLNMIYNEYLSDKIDYLIFKNKYKKKYKKEFKYLEKEFEIKKVDITNMSSIEWEGIFKKSLELILLDKKISSNIQFSTIFNTRYLLNSPKSIVRNKTRLLKSLKDNPIYKYTLGCKECLGEIHWVKSKSLSKEAKKIFLEDLVSKGGNKNKYKGRLKQAIFFELTEVREDNRSFSRWIFLKDGTLILWQLKGGFLMNISKELIKEKGYVCLEIKTEDLNVK